MLGYLKMLPILIALAGVGFMGHLFIVNNLESRVNVLQTQADQLRAENVAFQTAQATNLATIQSLQNNLQQQIQQITGLQTSMSQLEAEKNEYLKIFREHDLQRLALARPGLIEPRINNGTDEVFRSIERDSQEIQAANGEE